MGKKKGQAKNVKKEEKNQPGGSGSQEEGARGGGRPATCPEQERPQQSARGGRGQPSDQRQVPPQQGAWGGRGEPSDQRQAPPQQSAWGGRGQPSDQRQAPPQQSAWGGRGQPSDQRQAPPQQSAWGGRGQPSGQQQAPPQQSAWGGRGQPSDQRQVPPQQGAWGGRGEPSDQRQAPPQQSAWGGRGQPSDQRQAPPQQSAWGGRGQPSGQQQAPPQQSAWGGRRPATSPEQESSEGGSWRTGGSSARQQQGSPQKSAWRGRGQSTSQQEASPQKGSFGTSEPPASQQEEPIQKGPGGDQKKDRTLRPVSRSPEWALEFAPRIVEPKKSGTPITVSSNFFRLIISNPNITICHYDVVMDPDKPKFLLRKVWNAFMAKEFPDRLTAFDGKNSYSNGPLIDTPSHTGTVTVFNTENSRDKEFNVTIKEVRRITLNCFENYREKMAKEKTLKVLPEAELNVLDIIMRDWACDNLIASGKHFFPTVAMNPNCDELSKRLDLRFGFFQSAFLGYVPYLNFDISHKAFYHCCPVLDILDCFRKKHSSVLDFEEFDHFMRTTKVEYQLPNNPESRRVYRVNKIINDAHSTTFEKEGTKITVAQYFMQEKKCKLKYPDLPLLWVGPSQKSIYLPIEFCRLHVDQVYKGILDPREIREMVQKCTSNAPTRFNNIKKMFAKANLNSRPLMREFGLSVASEMEKVPARILAPPTLKTTEQIRVNDGVWRIRSFLQPMNLTRWCILNTDKFVKRESVILLQNTIKSKGANFNMQIGNPSRDPMEVEPSFVALKRAFSQLRNMELVFVIISEAKGLYSRIKTICETQEGVLTQCVKGKTLSQDPRKLTTTVDNIFLKINSKLGGKNYCLNTNSMPACLEGYTMIVGADVTHSSPGMKIPSVAAVAVSCDPAAFQYGITIRVQPKGEIIIDLQEIMKIHLKKFYELRKHYPDKIIFFRDGVSEGELAKVLKSELLAVKNACNPVCKPNITFIVVQKRHHTRFFPTRREDEQGKNFNVPVGTCVDSHIVHPRDLDFYLLSHASILGTARPTRYRLLYDDNRLTDEEVEKLSYYLCHLFARCNRSVSYPSPTYNAHLAAFRARAYLEGLNITNEDIPSIQQKMTDNISKISPMFFV